MKRKIINILFCITMLAGILTGCSKKSAESSESVEQQSVTEAEIKEEDTLEGTHVFMFKSGENYFGNLLYEGFAEYLTEKGEKVAYQAPIETTVEAQVQIMEELIAQKVASITISANGSSGYEAVLEKAKNAGIPVISVDSEINSEYRICHINQVSTKEIGAYLVQAAVLIAMGVDYPENECNMDEVVTKALASYSGKEIVLGVLSAREDTPVQNSWIASMEEELTNSYYAGKVSGKLDKKYGKDEYLESVLQANEFVEEDKVDCIIAPTTIGIQAAGQVLANSSSEIKLTGLGFPSEMQAYMPGSSAEDAFSYVCPYMMLWDVVHLGATAGAVSYAVVNDGYTGEAETSFTMDRFREYETNTYTAIQNGEGTMIIAGEPYVFHKGNMEEWVDRL